MVKSVGRRFGGPRTIADILVGGFEKRLDQEFPLDTVLPAEMQAVLDRLTKTESIRENPVKS